MIAEIISPRMTMEQTRDEREVYPEVATYVDGVLPRILILMKSAEKKNKGNSWHTLEWGAIHPRPKVRDEHQLILMLEAEIFRKLKAAGADMKEILPRPGSCNMAIHWAGHIA